MDRLTGPLLPELRRLEESLWREQSRFDADHLDRVLHREFREVGRSGRTWSRAEVVAAPRAPLDVDLPLARFDARRVDARTVLVTYVSVLRSDGVLAAHRSSLWVGAPGGWQLLFHQGTPTDA